MALTINVWSKVGVSIQTALAPAKTITAITKASPPVATSTAHGFTNGTEVKISCSGMNDANNIVCRVANVTANTFELEGLDSTLWGTFAAGTAQAITFGAEAATFQDINSSGGESKAINVTTIHDDIEKEIPGTKSALSFTFGGLWDAADPALLELKKADMTATPRCIRLTFKSGAKVYFDSRPSASLAPGGSAGNVVTTQVGFSLTGSVVAYQS